MGTMKCSRDYGVATISRLLKIIGLFWISSLLKGSFAKETCNFKEPTHRSHPIVNAIASWPYVAAASRLLKYKKYLFETHVF